MATFDRGFKIWGERTSIGVRRELSIRPHGPLLAHDLAKLLEVEIITPDDVQALQASDKFQLLKNDPSGWSAVTIQGPDRHVIIYNPRHSLGRQSSDLMHELAHIIIGHEPSRLIISQNGDLIMRSYNQKQEDEAAWLSGCLLLPREALLFIRKSGMSDKEACERYRVSLPMLNARLRLTGVMLQMKRLSRLGRTRQAKS